MVVSIDKDRSGFKPVPIRENGLDLNGFYSWIVKNGAEIGMPSNPYEVLRYRCYDDDGKLATHILYRKETGHLTWRGLTFQHYEAFINGEPFPRQPARPDGVFLETFPTRTAMQKLSESARDAERYADWVARGKPPSPSFKPKDKPKPIAKSEVVRERLLERDGDECWFCGKAMGQDVTIEHLVPKSTGGRNMLANYALAHRSCNNRAADKPLIQKIEIRQKMRGK